MALRNTMRQTDEVGRPSLIAVLTAGFFGSLFLFLYALTQKTIAAYFVGTLASLGAGAVGGVTGFIFALPRYVPEAQGRNLYGEKEQEPRRSSEESQAREPRRAFVPSDNLVQISDWLTKLLIGAGLVQLGTIGRWLGHSVKLIAGGMVNTGKNPVPASALVVAGSVIIFYFILSFLWFYGNTSLSYGRLMDIKSRE